MEIASSAGQVRESALRTPAEQAERLLMFVGDLPEGKAREDRAAQEYCWTAQKQCIEEYYLSPPTTTTDGLLATATNATSCYAFRGPQNSLYAYYQACAVLEQQSAYASWKWQIINLQLRSEAEVLRSTILGVAQNDPQLAGVAEKCVKRIERMLKELPQALSKVELPVPAPRPGEGDPDVLLVRVNTSVFTPTPTPAAAAADEWTIWSCNALERKNHWTASRCDALHVKPGSIPCMAVSKSHMAVLWQQPEHTGLRLRIYKLSDFGRPHGRPEYDWVVELGTVEDFVDDGQGMLTLSLSDDGVCCVACSNAVWVVAGIANGNTTLSPASGATSDVASSAAPGAVSGATVILLRVKDRKFKRNITCASATADALLLATAYGECYTINYKAETNETLVKDVERILACEPIYSAYTSNRRLILQNAIGIAGRFIPYHSADFFYLPSGRILGSSICGTLIFALEKYGALLVYSTVARTASNGRPVSPFVAPDRELYHSQGMGETLVAYPAVHASSERVIVLYPTGLIRVLQIKAKVARKIADGKVAAVTAAAKGKGKKGGKKKGGKK